jgi:transposase
MTWRDDVALGAEQRLTFVREYDTELFTMTELAAQYGISRKTANKWLQRYEAHGWMGCAITRGGRITVRANGSRTD